MSSTESSTPNSNFNNNTNSNNNNNSDAAAVYQSKSAMGYFWAAREYITPTLKTSQFLKKGVLTPTEFVNAGDELTFRCPTWTWESGDPTRIKPYLPPNKQFLITRNVPCTTRVAFMEEQLRGGGRGGKGGTSTSNGGMNDNEDEYDDDGEWLVSNIMRTQDLLLLQKKQQKKQQQQQQQSELVNGEEDDFDIIDEDGEVIKAQPASTAVETGTEIDVQTKPPYDAEQSQLESEGAATDTVNTINANKNVDVNDNDDDDEYADMADYEDDNILVDDENDNVVSALASKQNPALGSSAGAGSGSADDETNVLKVRTYDLSITYDKYYQTPRIWMSGKSERTGSFLTGKQMMEDVMSDYANRTVTIEQHPHLSGPHASIHPCKHGAVMKTIVQNLLSLQHQHEQQKKTIGTTTGGTIHEEGIVHVDEEVVVANDPPGSITSSSSSSSANTNHPTVSVEMYLFIFLKFVSSIIPTINYDFTMDVTADTSKK